MSKQEYTALAHRPLKSLQRQDFIQIACSAFSSAQVKRACWKLLGVPV